MIFIGGGALLSHAVDHAIRCGHRVRLVSCPPGDPALPRLQRLGVEILLSANPSADLLGVLATEKSDIVFSINNRYILDDVLLTVGPKFFNIHNGLVEKYRGLSEICVFSAVCRDEREYGVTLHRLLPGQKVDAGPVVDQLMFAIGNSDEFHMVMTQSLAACRTIFENNLSNLADGTHGEREPLLSGTAFSYRDVPAIIAGTDPERLRYAARLGPYAYFFPRLAAFVAEKHVA